MQHPPCGCHVCGQSRPPEKYPPATQCLEPCPPPNPCCKPPKQPCCPPPRPKPCRPQPNPCCEPPKQPCCPPPRPNPCCPQPKPCKTKTEGVLLQKIVACERRNIPSLSTELTLEGLPCCATPPFRLLMVQQSGAQPWWTPLDNQGPNARLCIKVSIPVCCQVQDCCGKLYNATSVVEAEASLRPPCPLSECWRHSIFVAPCVRLCMAECCSQDCTFQACLQVSLELYLLRPEPCMMHKPEPACPDLPLYPPPIRPDSPCWPQCPAGPAPCGWPRQG